MSKPSEECPASRGENYPMGIGCGDVCVAAQWSVTLQNLFVLLGGGLVSAH